MTSRALTAIFAIFAASLLGISAFTACATDDAVIGPPPTPQPEGSTSGGDATVGDAAQDSATDSATGTDAADAAPDLSKLTCGELSAAYSTELQKSHTCNVNAFANECTAPRERTLGCGCNTFVNANGVGLLDQIAAQWKLDKCAVACPAVVCKEATAGTCSKDGTCGDVFGAAPNP
jgi:hypothetical protein